MRATCLCFVFISLPNAVFAISCLVMRPGYGFTSEACPSAAVGCRIKARSDHVEWYEWSKLYDRNQLVCVYPGEYDGLAGCVRKHSGNIRCWCGGTDDCNTPEMSRQLVDAFQGSDRKKMEIIMRNLEMGFNQGEEVKVETTTTEKPTTTTTAGTTRAARPSAKKVTHKKPHQKATKMTAKTQKTTKMTSPSTTTASTTSTTTTTTTTTMKTVSKAINNIIEEGKAFPLPGDTFDETRKRLNEEMKEEDERLQQLLADEEAEMISDDDETREEREEQRRRDRERNRMERTERARADERRRLTEEETLRNNERSQNRETLPSSEQMDEYDYSESSSTTTIYFLSLLFSLLVVLLR